jgi:hypothetical protein
MLIHTINIACQHTINPMMCANVAQMCDMMFRKQVK